MDSAEDAAEEEKVEVVDLAVEAVPVEWDPLKDLEEELQITY